MKFKDYFLLLVSDDSSRSFKIKISSRILSLIILIAIVLFLFSAYSFYLYFTVTAKINNVKNIQLRNIRISKQLVSYSAKVNRIESTLDKIKIMSSKLSLIAHISDRDRHTPGTIDSLNNMLEDFEDVYNGDTDKVEQKLKEIKQKIVKLEYDSILQEEKVSALSDYLAAQSSLLASTPAILPVHGWLSSPFGIRVDPFTGKGRRHDGIDIAARLGTPVMAPADGIIAFTGKKVGYGNMVVIDHGYGITTRYGHLSKILVLHGSHVSRGMPIAAVGNTGRSTGPHLHYEIRLNGVAVNPMKFILDGFWDN